MRNNVLETILGGVVLVIGAAILIFAYGSGKSRPTLGYTLMAKFDRIDGLLVGNDVRVSGIKVGSVTTETLDPKTYMAEVTITVDPKIQLPTDTVAEVASESLLGGKYLALVPGGADEMLKPGEEITHTQASVNLESMIGQLIFSKSDEDKDKAGAKSTSASDDDGPSPF